MDQIFAQIKKLNFLRSEKPSCQWLTSSRAYDPGTLIYASSECCREAGLIAWIAEEMGRQVPWPLVVYVDNAAGVSYQHSTCASSKLRGVYGHPVRQRSGWVLQFKELKGQLSVTAEKVKTDKNLADLYTKCHSIPVRAMLQQELEEVAERIASRM